MKKYLLLLILTILLFLVLIYLFKIAISTHLHVKFPELRPFHLNVPVYYKGIKVGKVLARNHTKDYRHTLVTLVIYPRGLKLPEGTTAYLKKHKLYNYIKQDYIDLEFPKEMTGKYLSNNSTIMGRATIDINEYGANQNLDEIEEIKDNLAKSSENLNYALGGLSDLFGTINEIMEQNRVNLYKTTTNFSNATNNFSSVAEKFDNSIDGEKLNSTFGHIEGATGNLNSASRIIDENICEIEATINNLQEITNDACAITKGARRTLSKPFGGLRLFFGRPIQENTCP